MLSELKKIAENSTLPQNTRASAALSVSQCLTMGYDSVYNTDDVLFWLKHAMTLGSPFALQWFSRFSDALCPAASMLSQTRLSDVLDPEVESNESFLVSSIRRTKLTSWRIRPLDTAQDQRLVSISGPAICESCLSGEDVDLLWDALGGFDAFFDLRMETDPPKSFDVASPQGFTPVHCACLGGHLSTLRLLLDMGYSGIQSTIHGITPLHLCIFFAECDMEAAVHLLLECGPCPSPRETTSQIYWPDYDLTLSGSPLSWAIITRNLKLVKILLPEYSEDRPTDIRNALKNYYWEILDEILRTSPSDEDLWDIYVFVFAQLPYRHWIAHGSDRFSSIDRTLEVIQRHNLIPIEESRYLTSNLMVMMERTSTEEHFHHIERLLELMTASQIKETDKFHNTVLAVAIIRAKKNTVWVQTFKGILAHYSVEELQTTHFHSAEHGIVDASFLHSAVLRDCVVGARALLEKGVDPNQHSGGRVALTPIHLCVTVKCSVEMWDTLLEFGANMNVETLQSLSSPVTLLTAGGHFENSRLIDHIMKTDHHGEVILNMLLQLILLEPTPESRRYALLRHLLVIPNVAKHLNASTSEGFTLLQLSVLYGLLEITQLLLEAGADPLTGFRFANKNVYPLQVACAMGRFYGDKFTPRNRPLSDLERSKQEKWTRIALLLLEWQVAKNNDPFQGITQLHIASYISIEKEIQRFLAEGMDPKASGKWPHLPEGITPHRLIRTQTAYTKRNEIDNEKNIYKKVWRDQWSMFDRNMTSKSTINTYDLIIHELSAARFLLHCVRKWCKHWSRQELLSAPDGFD
jgi:ankyrin repeat protein